MEMGPTGFAKLIPVSRETLARLEAYVGLLAGWNRRINLVGRATMADVWRRHILDSAQLFAQIPPRARVLVDLGSGAGLPGLILAIMGVPEVHLIESDRRKSVFLAEAARVTETPVRIHARRIEEAAPFPADVVTARALAPLPELYALAGPFLGPKTLGLFLKGRGAREELTAAGEAWKMVKLLPSVSDPSGHIVRVETGLS